MELADKIIAFLVTINNYINGTFVPPAGGRYLDNFNPATGQISGRIPDSGPDDIDQAVAAARRAFPSWAAMHPEQRHDICALFRMVFWHVSMNLQQPKARIPAKPSARPAPSTFAFGP